MTQHTILDEIYEQCVDLVHRHFPDFPYTGGGFGGPAIHVDFPNEFKHFKKTDYYFNGELRFVHWTTIEKLCSILNTGEFRLYNLINSEDPNEFYYAANLLDLNDNLKDWIKDNYFTISFCKMQDLNNKYLWNKYGREYQGVAIEFSIVNHLDNWERFYISNVYYELPSSFSEFNNEWKNLKARYQDSISLEYDIWKLAGFHKQNHYKNENEVRIATFFPFRNYEEKLKYSRKEFRIDGKLNRIVTYVPLKLWINFQDSHYPYSFYDQEAANVYPEEYLHMPHIKIENVYFGYKCGIGKNEFLDYRKEIQEIIHFQLGYRIDMAYNLFGPVE
ncbi:MAG: hypothetical protein C5B59_00920 [Bacteroidetes bacterium]|nr:MAG: hypothetical protein C5B59_00920 [Bacteroidota bacterium]